MPILQTRNQKLFAGHPTKLEALRELDKRDALDGKMGEELYNLELGDIGEQAVLNCLREFGLDHWTIFQNLWLYKNGKFECDLVLQTRAKLYHFEIKNYTKDFVYQSGQCYFNGEKMSHNVISQAQRAFINFETILRTENFRVPLESVLVFVGEHSEVSINEPVQDVTIKTFNQLRDYIFQIAAEERAHRGNPLDTNGFVQILERHELDSLPFPAEPITEDVERRLRLGIMCSHCGSFAVDCSTSMIVCGCGMHEPWENAIVRTVCEYGVIYFDRDLVTSNVLAFFEGEVSRNTLFKYLDRHFDRVGHNRGLRFINKGVPFRRCYNEFQLAKQRSLLIRGY